MGQDDDGGMAGRQVRLDFGPRLPRGAERRSLPVDQKPKNSKQNPDIEAKSD